MQTAPGKALTTLLVAASILVTLKLFLVSAQPIKAVASGSFDDALFVTMAKQLWHGSWLGDYTNLTLAKGPGAPMFMAAARKLHVPLPVAQHLLHSVACLLAALALRPVARRDWWLVLTFVVLLFSPMTFDAGIMTRVSRSHVYSSMILVSVVSLAGLATWRRHVPLSRWLWAPTAGFAAGYAWITREETAMIAPAILVCTAGMAAWLRSTGSPREAAAYLGDVAMSGIFAVSLVSTIAAINLANYQTFVVTEIRGGAFARAYGALTRIPPIDDAEHIAMTEEARRTAYRVSPSFRELEPFLEGPRGDFWIATSREFIGLPSEGRGIHRGWFMWALRDAVADAGHYSSAVAANEFYERVEAEVNDACRNPALGCEPPRATPRPALTKERVLSVARSWLGAIRYLVTLQEFTALTPRSIGSSEAVAKFSEMTRWPSSPIEGQPARPVRILVLHQAGRAIGLVSPVLTLAAVAAWIVAIVAAARRRAPGARLVVATTALVLTLSVTVVVAMVDGLAFPAVNILYLAPAYPALALFWCTAAMCVVPDEREA